MTQYSAWQRLRCHIQSAPQTSPDEASLQELQDFEAVLSKSNWEIQTVESKRTMTKTSKMMGLIIRDVARSHKLVDVFDLNMAKMKV